MSDPFDPSLIFPDEDGTHPDDPKPKAEIEVQTVQEPKRRGPGRPRKQAPSVCDEPYCDNKGQAHLGAHVATGSSVPANKQEKPVETSAAPTSVTVSPPPITVPPGSQVITTVKGPKPERQPLPELPPAVFPIGGEPKPTSILDLMGDGTIAGNLRVTRTRSNLPKGAPSSAERYFSGYVGTYDQADLNLERKLTDQLGGGDFLFVGLATDPKTGKSFEKKVTVQLAGDSKPITPLPAAIQRLIEEAAEDDGEGSTVSGDLFGDSPAPARAPQPWPQGPGNGYPQQWPQAGPFGPPQPHYPWPRGPFTSAPGVMDPLRKAEKEAEEAKRDLAVKNAVEAVTKAYEERMRALETRLAQTANSPTQDWLQAAQAREQAEAAKRAQEHQATLEKIRADAEVRKAEIQAAEARASREAAAAEARWNAMIAQANAVQAKASPADPFAMATGVLGLLTKLDEFRGANAPAAPEKHEAEIKAEAAGKVIGAIGQALGPVAQKIAEALEKRGAPAPQQAPAPYPAGQAQVVRRPQAPPQAPAPQIQAAPKTVTGTVAPAPAADGSVPAPAPTGKPTEQQLPEGLVNSQAYLKLMGWVVDKYEKGNDPELTAQKLKEFAAQEGVVAECQGLAQETATSIEGKLGDTVVRYGMFLSGEIRAQIQKTQDLCRNPAGQAWVNVVLKNLA